MTDITNTKIENDDVILAVYNDNIFTVLVKNDKFYSVTKGIPELIEFDPALCTFIVILPDNQIYNVKEDLDKIRKMLLSNN